MYDSSVLLPSHYGAVRAATQAGMEERPLRIVQARAQNAAELMSKRLRNPEARTIDAAREKRD
jgi:hypothetical protein